MAEQTKVRPSRHAGSDEAKAETATLSKKGEKLKADIDGLLDEIDDILEENAEEFVASYVQRGGE
jgi:ubiquitin-like protein Pup